MITYKASKVNPVDGTYIPEYGWYWTPYGVCRILTRAFIDLLGADCLPHVTFRVNKVIKVPAGHLGNGCHETLYSMTVLVESYRGYQIPTTEQVKTAMMGTGAQFEVESVTGGYHFFKVW